MDAIGRCVKELELAGFYNEEGIYEGGIGLAVQRLLNTHLAEGHSGMSTNVCSNLFKKLIDGEILTPLTGEDDEWDNDTQFFDKPRCSLTKH